MKKDKEALVFVYTAGNGLFNLASDIAHKIFSPQTYQCQLCALTHSNFGMRQGWKSFLETLNRSLEFLHSDELQSQYGLSNVALPAVFVKKDEQLRLLISADEINGCQTLDDLQNLIRNKIDAPSINLT